MKKVRKLTPATLKRIIAEERYKLNIARKNSKQSKKVISEDRKWHTYVKLLRVLKEANNKKSNDIEKIDKLRSLIKRRILKGL